MATGSGQPCTLRRDRGYRRWRSRQGRAHRCRQGGRDQFIEWVTALGCNVHIDRVGNLFARYEGTDPSRAPVVIGSHLDSQPTGGKYDGAYGVMVGLEVLRVLRRRRQTCGSGRGRVVDQ